ncbi:MAG: CRISPR-associated protein Cas4 [Chloroflexota bacterium]|nr:CRISPR-associated protein Cas4 [Chloroflexota bacterium]MDQ5864603.1 CRISPR-associated protein Cas4 [Chloroflexota bacterium]
MGVVLTALAGGVLLLLALLALTYAARLRRESGLPSGEVLQSDTGAGGTPGKPLYSARYGLAGTPDYIVQTRRGLVPVEVKLGRTEDEPHESHLLQVLAYCLLIEETEGKRPAYGLLRYSNNTFQVDYNKETRAYLISVLDEMRHAALMTEVDRNHDNPARCRACGYRPLCDQSLWPGSPN